MCVCVGQTDDEVAVRGRPMATSNDVILTTSRHSCADLTNIPSTRQDSNVAACYGVDTVHDWATTSLAAQWRLHNRDTRSMTVDTQSMDMDTQSTVMDTSSVDTRSVNTQSTVAGELGSRTAIPTAPPRTKRKARAALATSFDKGLSAR